MKNIIIRIGSDISPLISGKAVIKEITPYEISLRKKNSETGEIEYANYSPSSFIVQYKTEYHRENILMINRYEILIRYLTEKGEPAGYDVFRLEEYENEDKVKGYVDMMLKKVRNTEGLIYYLTFHIFRDASYFFLVKEPLFIFEQS